MTKPVTIIGNHISPFVRKVVAVCEIKSIPYEMDSIVPFFGNDEFERLSPLRRIPVLIDGDTVLLDSSVIAEYLEEKWPDRPVLPRTPADRAKARWLDEFADTRIADVLLWRVFGKALVAPAIFKAPRDLDAVAKTMAEDIPPVMDYLEIIAPAEGFLFGSAPGLADVSVASHFMNARWARQSFDAARWPRAVGWIERAEAADPLRRLNEIGAKILRAPPGEHKPVLESFGVATTETTVGGTVPRRGPMTVL